MRRSTCASNGRSTTRSRTSSCTYIQAKYLGEDLTTDGCEMQAAEVQRWFREEYALPKLDVAGEATGTAASLPGGAVTTCVLTPDADATRAVRCVTGSRAVPG